jgi:hypothetical protein
MYPRLYREQYGAEMLATLADVAQSRSRPMWREVAALTAGALRAWVGAAAVRSAGQAWLSALRVSVLLLVAQATAQASEHATYFLRLPYLTVVDWAHAAAEPVVGALALVTVARGRYRLGILLAWLMLGIALWQPITLLLPQHATLDGLASTWERNWPALLSELTDGHFWPIPLTTVLLLPLLRRRPIRAEHPTAWLLVVPSLLVLFHHWMVLGTDTYPFALLAGSAACLACSAIDPRVPIAGAALLIGPILTALSAQFYLPVFSYATDDYLQQNLIWMTTYATASVVMTSIGALLVRRQARL